MPKRISKAKKKRPKRPPDVNQLAHELVRLSTQEKIELEPALSKSDISRIMAEMGRKGGKIGGKRRLETVTQERRSEIAHKAAQARWAKSKKQKA